MFVAYDTVLGRDVTIEPSVFFSPGVTVADNVLIRANSHIEGARLASGVKAVSYTHLTLPTILRVYHPVFRAMLKHIPTPTSYSTFLVVPCYTDTELPLHLTSITSIIGLNVNT